MWKGKPQKFYDYKICAETQADAIVARGASGTITAADRAQVSDAATQQLLLTNARSSVPDVVRHLTWTLCNARMNDDIGKELYQGLLAKRLNDSMVVLQQQALGKIEGAVAATVTVGSTTNGVTTIALPTGAVPLMVIAPPAPKPQEPAPPAEAAGKQEGRERKVIGP
jgi:hypothetical protein